VKDDYPKAEDPAAEDRFSPDGIEAYRAAAELVGLVIWVYDIPHHRIIMGSDKLSQNEQNSVGLPRVIDDVPASVLSLFDDSCVDDLLALYAKVDAGEDGSCVVRYKDQPEGSPRFRRLYYHVVRDDDGHPLKAFGTELDASAFVQMSGQLEETEKRLFRQSAFLERLYESIPVGIMQCDAVADPIILNGNPRSFEILGIDEEDIRPPHEKHVYDTVFPDDVAIVQTENHELAKRGLGGGAASYTHRIVTPSGVVRWINAVSQLGLNENGVPLFTVILNDVTEVRELRAFEERETSLERRSYLAAMRAAFERSMLIDLTENRFTIVDTENYGYSISPAGDFSQLFDSIIDSIVPEDRERFSATFSRDALLAAARAGKADVQMELRQVFDDGSLHWVLSRDLLLKDDKSGHWLCVALIQITDRMHEERERHQRELQEALDEAQSANEAKTDFLSRMSHDIRTPLNGIIGMTRIARENEADPAAIEDCLDKIDTSSHLLLGLINDILDLTKVEGGKMELHLEPYTSDEFFAYLDTVIRPACDEKGIVFSANRDGTQHEYVPLMDKLRTNQILFNLLSNAIKFTPEGGMVSYIVRDEILPDGRMGIDMIVSDNGIGMSEDFQKDLFKPFVQENRIDALAGEGSGLGLAIVKQLVDLMGGSVTVKSVVGKGSTFTVHVDCDCVAVAEMAPADVPSDGRADSLAGLHILLCEDHPLNEEIAVHMLEHKGMVVTAAEDGQRGLEAFCASPVGYYDAVLMDVRMPVMDGLEATRAIRVLNRADATRIPIIAMTADAFADDVRRVLDAGMDAHIAKPVDPEVLYGTLARLCG